MCPRCYGKQICPCKSCVQSRLKKDIPEPTTWINHVDGDYWAIECGYCGLRMGAEAWDDWEWLAHKSEEKRIAVYG